MNDFDFERNEAALPDFSFQPGAQEARKTGTDDINLSLNGSQIDAGQAKKMEMDDFAPPTPMKTPEKNCAQNGATDGDLRRTKLNYSKLKGENENCL